MTGACTNCVLVSLEKIYLAFCTMSLTCLCVIDLKDLRLSIIRSSSLLSCVIQSVFGLSIETNDLNGIKIVNKFKKPRNYNHSIF